MTPREVTDQLRQIASTEDFASRSAELVDHWKAADIGFEAVEPILQFMEEHPAIDFGMPGALAHFAESFHRNGYELKLLESITRRPTRHTVWMLNRVINGTSDPDAKRQLIIAMVHAKSNPLVDSDTLNQTNRFLERFGVTET